MSAYQSSDPSSLPGAFFFFFNVDTPVVCILSLLGFIHTFQLNFIVYRHYNSTRAVNFSILLDVLPQFCGTDPVSPASILLEETEHMSCHLGVDLPLEVH